MFLNTWAQQCHPRFQPPNLPRLDSPFPSTAYLDRFDCLLLRLLLPVTVFCFGAELLSRMYHE
jgi:hypothetical protein